MTRITLLEPGKAPEEAKATLDEIRQTYGGMVPPAFGIFSANPRLLAGQWSFHKTVMTPTDRVDKKTKEAIALTVSALNGCAFCIWAHTRGLKAVGASEDEIQAIRDGSLETQPLASIVGIARAITNDANAIDDGAIEGLRKRGFEEADVLDIVTVAAYFNELNRVLDALGVEAPA